MRSAGNSRRQLTCLRELRNNRSNFSLCFGRARAPGRLKVIAISQQIHEAQPEAPPLHFLISAWGDVTYRYISDAMDGARRLLRMPPGNVRKNVYRRKAFPPDAQCKHRWEFPTTWLMDHHTGYWQSIAIPKMEGRISKSPRNAVAHQPTTQLRAAG